MNVNLSKCKTSAQAVTKICYKESTRNLNFRIQCEDLEDLKECVHIIKGYNNFDWKKINEALDKHVGLKRFYGEKHPNNGNDLFEFEIAREGSPAIYIKYFKIMVKPLEYYARDGKAVLKLNLSTFEAVTDAFQGKSLADEYDISEKGGYVTCRLWWD